MTRHADCALPSWRISISITTQASRRVVLTPTKFNAYTNRVVPIHKALLPGQQKAEIKVYGDYSVTCQPQLEMHRHPIPLPEDLIKGQRPVMVFEEFRMLSGGHKLGKHASESQRRKQGRLVTKMTYALYCGSKRNKQPRWVLDVVTEGFDSRTVNVRVNAKGPTWRPHKGKGKGL